MKKYFLCIFSIILFHASALFAVEAVITAMDGNVGMRRGSSNDIKPIAVGAMLETGDVVITGKQSSAELTLSSGHMIVVDEQTAVKIETLEQESSSFSIPKGKLRAKVSKLMSDEEFEVKTPAATCSIRGTEFEVAVGDAGKTLLTVFAGIVEAQELVTGGSVMVGAGHYSSITSGRPPEEPKPIDDKKNQGGKKEQASEDRFAEVKREIFEEISKQQVLDHAAEDIKNAEYQNGKVLVDAYGKRVRLEEYIMRPEADQFKYVVLNKRENRFDFGKILFTFNNSLPENLTDVTRNMFHTTGEAPAWYPTDVLSVMSNTIDSVTEDASGGHPEGYSIGNTLYYDTIFDTYDFYANKTRLYGYDNTMVPSEEPYYHGGAEPDSLWYQPDGPTTFHFIARDTYSDNTWIQSEDFIINDEGNIATFSDVVDTSNISADDIRDKVLQMNFERVYTSSLFDDRSIDVVYSAKLLADAGILNLPTSLGVASLDRTVKDSYYTRSSKYEGYQLARLRESKSDDDFPRPEKPYPQDTAAEKSVSPGTIRHMASLEILGGQYFVEGDNTNIKGNMDLLYVPVINVSENTAILPIYKGEYHGTKGVEELVGGGTLVQSAMGHSLYAKLVHKTASGWAYKNTWGFSGEWLAETEDETLSNGLFNNYRYSVGFDAEKAAESHSWKYGYTFGITDYYNYQALSSDDRFEDAGITSSMGTDVLDYMSHDVSMGYSRSLGNNVVLEMDYRISYLSFNDQKKVSRSGEYLSSKRNDFGHTLNVNTVVNTASARMGIGYGIRWYDSNQNAYDADRTRYTEGYYDYLEQKITPSVSFILGKDRSMLSLYWDLTFMKYTDRTVQNENGDYGTSHIGQVTNGLGMWVTYPVYRQLSLKMKMNYLMSSSNMKYESTYIYNYDVVNYFIGFSWSI